MLLSSYFGDKMFTDPSVLLDRALSSAIFSISPRRYLPLLEAPDFETQKTLAVDLVYDLVTSNQVSRVVATERALSRARIHTSPLVLDFERSKQVFWLHIVSTTAAVVAYREVMPRLPIATSARKTHREEHIGNCEELLNLILDAQLKVFPVLSLKSLQPSNNFKTEETINPEMLPSLWAAPAAALSGQEPPVVKFQSPSHLKEYRELVLQTLKDLGSSTSSFRDTNFAIKTLSQTAKNFTELSSPSSEQSFLAALWFYSVFPVLQDSLTLDANVAAVLGVMLSEGTLLLPTETEETLQTVDKLDFKDPKSLATATAAFASAASVPRTELTNSAFVAGVLDKVTNSPSVSKVTDFIQAPPPIASQIHTGLPSLQTNPSSQVTSSKTTAAQSRPFSPTPLNTGITSRIDEGFEDLFGGIKDGAELIAVRIVLLFFGLILSMFTVGATAFATGSLGFLLVLGGFVYVVTTPLRRGKTAMLGTRLLAYFMLLVISVGLLVTVLGLIF